MAGRLDEAITETRSVGCSMESLISKTREISTGTSTKMRLRWPASTENNAPEVVRTSVLRLPLAPLKPIDHCTEARCEVVLSSVTQQPGIAGAASSKSVIRAESTYEW